MLRTISGNVILRQTAFANPGETQTLKSFDDIPSSYFSFFDLARESLERTMAQKRVKILKAIKRVETHGMYYVLERGTVIKFMTKPTYLTNFVMENAFGYGLQGNVKGTIGVLICM